MGKTWPVIIYGFVLGIALDLGAAYILSMAMSERPSEIFWFWAGFIIIVPIIFSAWQLAKKWLFFFLSGKEVLTRAFLKDFTQNDFPSPRGEFDIDAYLLSVIEDYDAPQKARHIAGVMIGQIGQARLTQGLSSGLMMTIAAEAAIQRFAGITSSVSQAYANG